MNTRATVFLAIGCLAGGALLGAATYKGLISDPAERQFQLDAESAKCMTTLPALWELRRGHVPEAICGLERVQDWALAEMKKLVLSIPGEPQYGTSQLITNAIIYRLKFPTPPARTNHSNEPRWGYPEAAASPPKTGT